MRATPNMVLILPGLRQADGIVRKLWSSVYRTGKVPKNKLFVEMLEAAGYRNIASVAWILQGYCMDIAGILQQYCSNIASAAWILQEQAENLLD
ncbi:hypothetical protein PV326_011955, partial [Microctonus aethiopoides]